METKLTQNFTKGSEKKIGFVIHGTLGNYDGAVNWLYEDCNKRSPVTYSSAHYVIAKNGRCTQLVKNEDVSWHAGVISNPTPEAKAVLPKTLLGTYKNPNISFIGIELEWFVGDVVTEAQYVAMSQIIATSGIPNPILLTHRQITDYKSDFIKNGVTDLTVLEELKRRLSPPVTNVKEQIKNKMVELQELINKL